MYKLIVSLFYFQLFIAISNTRHDLLYGNPWVVDRSTFQGIFMVVTSPAFIQLVYDDFIFIVSFDLVWFVVFILQVYQIILSVMQQQNL